VIIRVNNEETQLNERREKLHDRQSVCLQSCWPTGERRSVRNWSFNCGGMTIGGFSCKISASICNNFMLNIVVSYAVKCMSLCMEGINYVIIKCKWAITIVIWAILCPRYDM